MHTLSYVQRILAIAILSSSIETMTYAQQWNGASGEL